MNPADVYAGSDGELTRALYAQLELRGPVGVVALNLFRACKNSERAKKYRGGIRHHLGRVSYRSMAYDRKEWALSNLAAALERHALDLGIVWGWASDPLTVHNGEAMWVLYVDLSVGQVSFHAPSRGKGPAYAGKWDGSHLSAARIVQFCDRVLGSKLSL